MDRFFVKWESTKEKSKEDKKDIYINYNFHFEKNDDLP